jgi:fluoride ion exporter CrcB/FEX
VLGVLFILLTERLAVAPWVRSGLTIGLVGSYTTFSTFSLETYRLAKDGAWGPPRRTSPAAWPRGLAAVYYRAPHK